MAERILMPPYLPLPLESAQCRVHLLLAQAQVPGYIVFLYRLTDPFHFCQYHLLPRSHSVIPLSFAHQFLPIAGGFRYQLLSNQFCRTCLPCGYDYWCLGQWYSLRRTPEQARIRGAVPTFLGQDGMDTGQPNTQSDSGVPNQWHLASIWDA